MAVETKIPYRVKEQTLKAWLEKNIGKDSSGRPLWSYKTSDFKAVKDRHAVNWWQVKASRGISKDEIEDMKIQEIKKAKDSRAFKFYDEDED